MPIQRLYPQQSTVNHAEKRMGTSLRKLMKHQKLGGGTNHDLAGINIQQRLTGNKGVRLYDYYGCAICKHAGDVGAMNNTIWTFLQMTLMQSENDDRVRRTEPYNDSDERVDNRQTSVLGWPLKGTNIWCWTILIYCVILNIHLEFD